MAAFDESGRSGVGVQILKQEVLSGSALREGPKIMDKSPPLV